MRRGRHDNWRSDNPETWTSHNARRPHDQHHQEFHGFSNRPAPRHWRPNFSVPFRPRAPGWRMPHPNPPSMGAFNNIRGAPPIPLLMRPPPRFAWTPPQFDSLYSECPSSVNHCDIGNEIEKSNHITDNNVSTTMDKDIVQSLHLHDTINTVKQKLRQRKVSDGNQEFVQETFPPGEQNVLESHQLQLTKPTERRRIEHSRGVASCDSKILVKKPDKKEGSESKSTLMSPPPRGENKSQIMRLKILQQLFKLDKNSMRQMLSNPDLSSKYSFAFQSLIKETRNTITQQVRSTAEKSLQLHETSADSLKGKQIVQDAFMGHLGTMLDPDASIELLNMDPQVIADLSKALQQDLMNPREQDVTIPATESTQKQILDVYVATPNGDIETTDDRYSFPIKAEKIDDVNNVQDETAWKGLPLHDYSVPPPESSNTNNILKIETNLSSENNRSSSSFIENFSGDTNGMCGSSLITNDNLIDRDQTKHSFKNKRNFCSNELTGNVSMLKSFPVELNIYESIDGSIVSDNREIHSSRNCENDYNRRRNSSRESHVNTSSGHGCSRGLQKEASGATNDLLDKNTDYHRHHSRSSHRSHNKYENRGHSKHLKDSSQYKSMNNYNNLDEEYIPTRESGKVIKTEPLSLRSDNHIEILHINHPIINTADCSRSNSNTLFDSMDESQKSPLSTKRMSNSSYSSSGKKRKLSEGRKSNYRDQNYKNEHQVQSKESTIVHEMSPGRSVGCQTDHRETRARGSQYHSIGKVDISTQVYESFIFSKSKGTQYVRQNSKEVLCQTLRVPGFPCFRDILPNNNIANFKDDETQTLDTYSFNKSSINDDIPHNTESQEISNKLNNVDIEALSNQDDILERMKQIDSDIQVLIQDKFKLYSMLDRWSSSSPTVSDHNKMSKFGMKIVQNVSSSNKSNMKSKQKQPEEQKRKDTVLNHINKDDKTNVKWFIGKQMNTNRNHKLSESSQPEIKPDRKRSCKNTTSSEIQLLQTSKAPLSKIKNSTEKIPTTSTPIVKKDRTCKSGDTLNKKNTSRNVNKLSEKKNTEKSTVAIEDINIRTRCNSIELSSFETNDESSVSNYYDLAGQPVSLDCNFVASEEVVENYEVENVADFQEINTCEYSPSALKKGKRDSKMGQVIGRNNVKIYESNSKKRPTENNLRRNCKLPPRRIPPLKIRKICNSRQKPANQKKVSPLTSLMSELNDLDGSDPDFNDSDDLSKNNVPNKIVTAAVELRSDQHQTCNLPDCFVRLDRLDINKLYSQQDLSADVLDISNSNCNVSLLEHDTLPNINESFFTMQDYDNIGQALNPLQFGHLCDTDVPSIIANIEENDSLNIIENWDSKLFENVTLSEDRDVFSEKTLVIEDNFNQQYEENIIQEPINFTDHKDSIIAIECLGDNFLAASLDRHVYYYSGKEGKLLRTLEVSNNCAVTCLCVKKQKYPTIVYTGSLDSHLRCFNFKTGEKLFSDFDVGGPIQCMCQEWDTIFVGTRTGYVLHFDMKSNSLVADSAIKFSDTSILALQAIKEGPRKVLLSASRSQRVTVKDATTGLLLRSFDGPNSTVYSILFDSGKVFCGTSGIDVQIFDFASGDLVGVHTGGNGAVCLTMYKGLLFTGCYDGMIYVFKLSKKEKPIACIPGPGKMLLALAVVDNKIIAGCKDKSLAIWPIPQDVMKEMKYDFE